MPSEVPTKETETGIQANSLSHWPGQGEGWTEVRVGLWRRGCRELLTKGNSKGVITSLLWGPTPRNPNSPKTVISRQNERRQPGTRP